MGSRLLDAIGVTKKLGDTVMVENISLDVNEQEVLVVMGPNGVGKTLLLCCLSGGLASTSGTINIRGRPLNRRSKRDLVMLVQDSMAIQHLTARENIVFYSRLHPASTSRWEEFVRVFELADDLDKTVRDYSGGMKRKLELAITLSIDTSLYLLDEPTAGLDLQMIQRVHDHLLEEVRNGKGFIISSHTPLDLEIADTVLFLGNGQVLTRGQPEALLTAMPTVVRIRGSLGRLPQGVSEYLIGQRLFTRGDEARGFLADEATFDDIEQITINSEGDFYLKEEAPTYVDLFNYQVARSGDPTIPVEER